MKLQNCCWGGSLSALYYCREAAGGHWSTVNAPIRALVGGAENVRAENAGVDSRGGKCRSGKYRSDIVYGKVFSI